MQITGVVLKNFRSYSDSAFEFSKGVNIIVGANASGKTNLLEAILVSCNGKSYRVKDIELIKFDQPWSRIEADTEDGKRITTVERIGDSTNKKFNINTIIYKRLSQQKIIPVVLFEPEHLRLLNGGPERRRDYLDNLLEQTVSGYAKLRREYKRTLAQRNALLKSGNINSNSGIFAWNIRLSELGGKIVGFRYKLVQDINEQIQDIYRQISENSADVKLEYQLDFNLENYSSNMLKALENNLDNDRLKGFTSSGPHRHDLLVALNSHTASVTASRGEFRSILLSLKMIELHILEQATGKTPILLLDDVFSELDGSRRKALTVLIKKYQTFITTTDADIVVHHFMNKCTIIPIS